MNVKVIDFCEAGVMVAKMNHECWNWTLRIFFGWPVAPSGYLKKEWRSRVVYSYQNMIYSGWPWSLEEEEESQVKALSQWLVSSTKAFPNNKKHISRVTSWSPNKYRIFGNTPDLKISTTEVFRVGAWAWALLQFNNLGQCWIHTYIYTIKTEYKFQLYIQ